MAVCYIAVGSNLGDRRYYIQSALKKIRQIPSTKVKKISSLRESAPVGGPGGQGFYLNGVAEIETELFPYLLLDELQKIERDLGRVRLLLNGPRTIDLDILAYGDVVMREEGLSIPHPRMFSRVFVLEPLSEIAPGKAEQLKRLIREKRQEPVKRPARRKTERKAIPRKKGKNGMRK